jgi:hypothetical protein
MPTWPPRSQPFRKKEILDKRVEELVHAVKHDYDPDKIEAAAEKVRYAKLKLCKGTIEGGRVFRAEDEDPGFAANAKREIEEWEQMPVSEIIARVAGGS